MNCSSQYTNPAFCLKYTGTAVLSSIIISIKLTVTTFFNKPFFINLMSFQSRKRYVACLLELITSKTWLCITRPTRLFCLPLYCFHCYEVISVTLTDWYLRSLSSWWYIQAFDDISCIWTWPDLTGMLCRVPQEAVQALRLPALWGGEGAVPLPPALSQRRRLLLLHQRLHHHQWVLRPLHTTSHLCSTTAELHR